MTLAFVILLTAVVTTIILDAVQRRSYGEGLRAGEEAGKLKERALWWERTARASERVEALAAAARVDDSGGEWELPDTKM